MEVIAAPGIRVHVNHAQLETGAAWDSEFPSGAWFGGVAKGEIYCVLEGVGEGVCARNQGFCFYAEQPFVSRHEAMKPGAAGGVFVWMALDCSDGFLDPEDIAVMRQGGVRFSPVHLSLRGQSLVWQLLSCNLAGRERRPYIISRAIDFAADLVSPNAAYRSPGAPRPDFLKSDIERLYEARSLLLEELKSPPSMPALARRVGINVRKLNRGFSSLFGCSAYAFLKKSRLEQARLMIETGGYSIAEVARAVGYHPAHFSTEFRRYFGFAPSQAYVRKADAATVGATEH